MALVVKDTQNQAYGPVTGALICAPDAIFDTKFVQKRYTQITAKKQAGKQVRSEISELLSAQNAAGRAAIETALSDAPWSGMEAINSYCLLTDRIIEFAFMAATDILHPNPTPTKNEHLCVMGVGGYGRAEMAPFSDVDLLFLSPYKLSAWSESVVESMLYILWDMRLKIGHATRTIDECIKLGGEDQTIKTALLESRYLVGDERLANQLDRKLWAKLFSGTAKNYVEEKLIERENRHIRQGGQRYMLEPNVKEGKGGLRDLQTMYWITKHVSHAQTTQAMVDQGYFTTSELERFEEAHAFLWTVRCHLHLYNKRSTEQLTFDAQVDISKRLGYRDTDGLRGVESFMQDYFREATHVGDLTRVFLSMLEAQHVKDIPSIGKRLLDAMPWNRSSDDEDETPDGYNFVNNRLAIADDDKFLADPLNIMRLFQVALSSDILIHPDAMRLMADNLDLIDDNVRNSPEAQRIFLELLLDYGNPERALRRMNELGVLGAFIPEFQRIIALMQFNNYHHYTVDEHTIQCISGLSKLELGDLKEDLPILTEVFKGTIDRKVLYVALLLHDIGKGLPEDHSIAGAKIAEQICPRLGLSEKETETVVWLVLNHLLMSDVAQKRDLSDPRTVINFAKDVKTTSRLNLLTALTVCDIRGVGPNTWNNWKAQLLRDLYRATRSSIKAGVDKIGVYNRVDEAKEQLQAKLADWSDDDLEIEMERHYDPYWQGLDHQSHITFANMLRDIGDEKLASEIVPDVDRDATRACFVMQDHPGIFSRIAGALALVGANVVDARTYTSTDGFATAIFWIQDADEKPYQTTRIKRLRDMIQKTLLGEVLAKKELGDRDKFKKRERDFRVPTEITFDNEGSELYSIIEVDTRDRPALLHDLTRTLSNANIYIASAVIATYGAQAVDVFYVKDMFGMKIHSLDKQKTITERLTRAIEQGTQEALS
ncbi:bifunctional uridylyltransferase/uridylyl-removing enzyme [Amylibacter ulvae]|uniref:Bifunctional uridylyltransferase/uridylyl-removing enzyme n=1 Tax=Paramylibacter ulvae TaxID=1651968 RepID=A0ABQ3CYL2_9RHOB|nr:[protein-PII] uridylyltransferase [Amylibacter ulvae]GHA50200.1 bifunctional uridylyltransferase/uridylyl-removing enzyme [Amylibacter ulvae]